MKLKPKMPTSSRTYARAWAAARVPVAYSRAMKATSDDVILASYPKSGNTWVKFVLAHALTGEPSGFDRAELLVPSFGGLDGAQAILPTGGRLIKSHERPRFFPSRGRRPKVLLLVRDGRDVAVSYYYHWLRTGDIDEGFDAFFDAHLVGAVGPYGSWHHYMRSWLTYARAHPERVCIVRYEDLLVDPVQHLLAASSHLGLGLSERAIRAALAANTPEEMRRMESSSEFMQEDTVNHDISFIRGAGAGTWAATLTASQVARLESVAAPELVQLGYELSHPAATAPAQQ